MELMWSDSPVATTMPTPEVHTTTELKLATLPTGIIVMSGTDFFDTYYSKSRFALETCLAFVSIFSNSLMLILTRGNRHRRHYSYVALFMNLLVANVLSALASWLTNNMMFLFRSQLLGLNDMCHVMLLLVGSNVMCKVFGAVAVTSLLGLSVVHCLAVCYPIAYVLQISTSRVHLAIALTWIITFVAAVVEIVVCIGRLTAGNCSQEESRFISLVTTIDADVSIVTLTLMYALIIALCVRIAAEIRTLQSRLNRLCWTDNLQQERSTFCSIVGLSATMIMFIFPYHILYFVSLNFDVPALSSNAGVMYYMILLPYIKYATDPVFFCRKRLVHWRSAGCFFGGKMCHSDDMKEERSLIDEHLSALTVNGHGNDVTVVHNNVGGANAAILGIVPPPVRRPSNVIVTVAAKLGDERASSFV